VYLPAQSLMRYGALAVAGIALLMGGVFYLHLLDPGATEPAEAAVDSAKPAAVANAGAHAEARAAAPMPIADPEEPAVPSQAQIDKVAHLIGDARRLAQDGKFDEAVAALDKADKLLPNDADTAALRRDIEQMSTPQGRLALQLQRARSAIAQDDRATAEKALAAAEQVDPQAPEIATLRQALQKAEQEDARRSGRIEALLADMRAAIARGDFVSANRALNEAERLDVRNPAIDPARVELIRAQDAASKDAALKDGALKKGASQ
jgi:tetratricopeptide (TPR) repeat protein